MRVSKLDALRTGQRLGVNFEVVSVDMLQHGMKVELEHGRNGRTNVIGRSLLKAAKIALAHLQEYPNYYIALERMEAALKRQWRGRRKPNVFLTRSSRR